MPRAPAITRYVRLAVRLEALPAGSARVDAALHAEAVRVGLLPPGAPLLPYSTDLQAARFLLPPGCVAEVPALVMARCALARCGPPGELTHNGVAPTAALALLAAICRAWSQRFR